MDELPPELVDFFLRYIDTKVIRILYLSSYRFHIISKYRWLYLQYGHKMVVDLICENDLVGVQFVHKYLNKGKYKYNTENTVQLNLFIINVVVNSDYYYPKRCDKHAPFFLRRYDQNLAE